MNDPVTATATGIRISLRVIPRSPKPAMGGLRDGRLLVRVTAPPVDSAANDAVVEFLASVLGVSGSAVTMVSGKTSRNKVVAVAGVSRDAAKTRLGI